MENTGGGVQTLKSIDIYAGYLEGVAILGSTPAAGSVSQGFGLTTYEYERRFRRAGA